MAEKYKCLNPVGIQDPVDLYPLAPRLDTLDGKTIYLGIRAAGEQGIMIPLQRRLPVEYPNINWKVAQGGNIVLTEEEMKTADGMILGVVW